MVVVVVVQATGEEKPVRMRFMFWAFYTAIHEVCLLRLLSAVRTPFLPFAFFPPPGSVERNCVASITRLIAMPLQLSIQENQRNGNDEINNVSNFHVNSLVDSTRETATFS